MADRNEKELNFEEVSSMGAFGDRLRHSRIVDAYSSDRSRALLSLSEGEFSGTDNFRFSTGSLALPHKNLLKSNEKPKLDAPFLKVFETKLSASMPLYTLRSSLSSLSPLTSGREKIISPDQKSQDEKASRNLFVALNSSDPCERKELLVLKHVGGKALRLAEMMAVQTKSDGVIRVPPAGCVTTFGYNHHIQSAKLQDRIQSLIQADAPLQDEALSHELTSIRKIIMETPIDHLVEKRIATFLQALPASVRSLAVRSSSTMEDAAGTSYAGQYDTLLNIPRDLQAVCKAVKSCWASMWQPHIMSYRKQLLVAKLTPAMAVVIQHQLNPDSAGVLFTLNPTSGNQEEMVIESCYGLGEGVVGGELSPQLFHVNWVNHQVTKRHIPEQTHKYAFVGTGDQQSEKEKESSKKKKGAANSEFVQLVSCSEKERTQPTLTDDQLVALCGLGVAVASVYGHPQDIEWAYECGDLYLLQARPITAFSVQCEERFSYAGFAESGLLALSLSAQSYADMMGILLDRENKPKGGGGFAAKMFSKILSGSVKPTWSDRGATSRARFFFARTYINSALWYDFSQLKNEALALSKWVLPGLVALEKENNQNASLHALVGNVKSLQEMSDEALCDAFCTLMTFQHTGNTQSYLVGSAVERCEKEIEKLVKQINKKLGKDEKPLSLASLVSGINVESFAKRSADQLQELALFVRSHPKLYQIFQFDDDEEDSDEEDSDAEENAEIPSVDPRPTLAFLESIRNIPDAHELVQRFDDYLKQFCYMSDRDEDVSVPRFAQYPLVPWSILVGLIISKRLPKKAVVKTRMTNELVQSIETEEYKREYKRFLDLTQKSSQQDRYKKVLQKLRDMLHWKETVHIIYTRNAYYLRHVIVEAALRLEFATVGGAHWIGSERNGTLDQHHPIWCIDFVNLGKLIQMPLSNQLSEARAAEVIELFTKGRAMHDMYLHFNPPNHIGGGRKVKIKSSDLFESLRKSQKVAKLKGLGCSAGVVKGTAVVAPTLTEASALVGTVSDPILITRYTDPSWTPLFAVISAIILEDGGALSHASVVSRECGLPCIVQVKDACHRLKTGDILVIDGEKGSLVVVNETDDTIPSAAVSS